MQQILGTLAVPLGQHLSVNSPNQGLDCLALDRVRASVLSLPSTWDTDSVCNWSVSIVDDHLWIQKYFLSRCPDQGLSGQIHSKSPSCYDAFSDYV